MSSGEIVLTDIHDPTQMVGQVVTFWSAGEVGNFNQIEAWDEVRRYVFAEDADHTSGRDTPWHNRTTRPKLTWIYDKMLSEYMKRLIPSEDFFRWKGSPNTPIKEEDAQAIQKLMENKLRQPEAEVKNSIEACLTDYILFGNTFATTEYKIKKEKSFKDGKTVTTFRGPKPVRISPWDVRIDPQANTYDESPIAYRTIERRDHFFAKIQNDGRYGEEFKKSLLKMVQKAPVSNSLVEHIKENNIQIDGVNLVDWWDRGQVEIIDYFGDIVKYNEEDASVTYLQDRHVQIVDRVWVAIDEENPSWLGIKPVVFGGYRARPENLWHQGPLANLVGMQYRIDHLENAKSDALDLMVYPIRKIQGDVTEEVYPIHPGAEWYVPLNGDVELLYPDPRTLMFDQDIMVKEQEMEEFAGVPRETAGFRTPGEKTSYEVQKLLQNAGEMPELRLEKFESNFLQPLLNLMLEQTIRNLTDWDLQALKEEDAERWKNIKVDDLKQDGRLYPVGSKHSKQRAEKVQNIVQLLDVSMKVAPEHVAALKALNRVELEMGLDEEDIIGLGYGLEEEMATSMKQQQLEQQFTEATGGAAQEPGTFGRRRREIDAARQRASESQLTAGQGSR